MSNKFEKGCVCDLLETIDQKPDECVFDNGDIADCIYATQIAREHKGESLSGCKKYCQYWKPVKWIQSIDDIGFIEELRKRLGLEPDDTRMDKKILEMTPKKRVKMLCAWFMGSEGNFDDFAGWCESQGVYLTTNSEDSGIIGMDDE